MKKFGLIGHPVGHSMSAVMQKAAFKKLDQPYTYELFDVDEGGLGSFMARAGSFSGLNVTIPHKVEVIKYLDEVSEDARLIGAVNTIKFGGSSIGYNTDGIGCVRALEEAGFRIKGMNAVVLGAGGAARAVVFQLALGGANVSIANRTRGNAAQLASDLKGKTDLSARIVDFKDERLKSAIAASEVLINTTSVGMSPNVGETPLKGGLLHPNLTVMDLVYNPVETRLLADARDAGCRTVDGVGMLVHQGAESLRIWLGVEPPVYEMRKAVLEKLM